MKRRPLTIIATFTATLAALAMVAISPSSRAEPTDAGAPPPASPEVREKLEGAKLDSMLADIARARKSVRTLRANFTQERKLTLLATSVKSTGELAYVAPERLRWELAPPDDIVYLIGPEGLSYRTRTSHATVPATGATIAKALADLRALLGGDLSLLKDRYTLSGSRSPSGNDVEIAGVAKDSSASVRGFTLTLDKSLILPVKARLIEGKSDAIDIVFSNAQINVPIDPATMKP